jgi:hypothetical protein
MTISSAGNVGIGSTAPSGRLDVETASDTYVNFSTTNNGSAAGICLLGNNNDEFFGYANSLRFATVTGKNAAGFNERCRLDASGRLLVGTTSSISNRITGQLQIVGTGDDSCASLTRYSSATTGSPILTIGRSKSSTKGTNTVVVNGDKLGAIEFTGADGTNFVPAASVSSFVDTDPGAGDMPGNLIFSTTPNNSSTLTERFRINNQGALGIGGENFGTSGQVLTSQGSGSAPQWADAGGGLYESYAMLRYVVSNNTNGGTNASGAWTTYPINTESFDPDNIVNLSSNSFTLVAGTYRIVARTVFYRVYEVQTKIRNQTTSSDDWIGMSGYASGSDESNFIITLVARVTYSSSQQLQIQYNAAYSRTSTGLGNPSNRGQQETYGIIEIFKEA